MSVSSSFLAFAEKIIKICCHSHAFLHYYNTVSGIAGHIFRFYIAGLILYSPFSKVLSYYCMQDLIKLICAAVVHSFSLVYHIYCKIPYNLSIQSFNFFTVIHDAVNIFVCGFLSTCTT